MSVYDTKGTESSSISLPKEIFGAQPNPRLLAQYVRVYLANQRQGTASSKTRGEVIGSTRKIYRQKGTGKARHGSIKAPIFVGGGVVGGPSHRDFSLKMNKKQKQKALVYSLSLKAKEGSILGLQNEFEKLKPKTKTIVEIFKKIGISESKVLIVVSDTKTNGLILSVRNLQNVDIIPSLSLNAYTILNHRKIVFIEEALTQLKKRFSSIS